MKKILALVLVLSMICTAAFAAQIFPLVNVDMESDLTDCTVRAEFTVDDITETDIAASIYDEVRYDAAEVSQLALGDVITTENGDITIESIADEDGVIEINGGFEEDGISLWADDGGTYLSVDYEYACLILRGQAQLTLADEIALSWWVEDEEGSIAEDPETETVAAAGLKDALTACGNEECDADTCFVTIENGLVTAIEIIYMP